MTHYIFTQKDLVITNLKERGLSYKTNISKKCNFGDYRIPESVNLDIGAGEFSPDPKFFDKGWKSYSFSLYGETEIEQKKEKEKWWK